MGAAGIAPQGGTPYLGGHPFKSSWPSFGPELVRAIPGGERRSRLKPELEVVLAGPGLRGPRLSCV